MLTLPNKDEFTYKECEIAGDKCWLITPNDIKVKWTPDNLMFRSIIVRQSDNFVVSCGFKKFFNWGEQPDLDPFPVKGSFSAIEKHDGSLLILSKYKGQLIHRTRGTVNAELLRNGHEIEFLKKKYPNVFSWFDNEDTCNYSLLFEWETPTNVIVLRKTTEPQLTFLGSISHDYVDPFGDAPAFSYCEDDYTYGLVSKQLGVPVPTEYQYNSIKECIEDVLTWKGKEGVVIRSYNNQSLRKIKGEEYCRLHALMTGYTTLGHILGVFLATDKFTEYKDFYQYIEKSLDFEIAERNVEHIQKITSAYKIFLECSEKIKDTIEHNLTGLSRKDQAMEIQHRWTGWKQSLAFCVLTGKTIEEKLLKQSLLHIIEDENRKQS